MALQATNIADLVATTINELNELKFTDISAPLQRYIAMSRLMKKHKVTFDAGPEVQWDLMTNDNGSAGFVGLYATDNVNVPDVMIQGKIPWRHITWNWAIERREIAMNRSPRKIVDLVKTRRIAAFVSAVEKFENRFWRAPASTDTINPFGVPYYIVKSNTTPGGDFTGTTPAGQTLVANISPTTYTRWRNWAFQYTAVTKDDMIRKWRKAAEFTDFDTPIEGMPTFNTGDEYGFYTNWAVLGTVNELLEQQNDDLGTDISSMDGKAMFQRKVIERVPQLEEDTTNPLYGINWGEFKTMGLRGEWLNETNIPIQPGQHTVAATHTDCSFNWLCFNRRRHFVGSTDTTMPT